MKELLCFLFGHKYYNWEARLNTDVYCRRCYKQLKKRIAPPPPKKTKFKQHLNRI